MGRSETHDLPALRAMIAVVLVVAITVVSVVTFNTARAAGALALGNCGVYGSAPKVPESNR